MYHYGVVVILMVTGLYVVMASSNLVKKVLGLNIFQTSVFLLYIGIGKLEGGAVPILGSGPGPYSNPLPQVLILTAIVVGVATTALALALIVRIHRAYGTIEEDDLERLEKAGAHPPSPAAPARGPGVPAP